MIFERMFFCLKRWHAISWISGIVLFMTPIDALANWKIVDALDLSPFVPMVLDALMAVATGGYNFFVGNGNGIIYLLIWGFLALSLALYMVKMFFPKLWVSFFGFSGGGEMANGITGMKIAENVLKPGLRAIIAATVLLQIKPIYVTEWLINPFLGVGSMYTEHIVKTVNQQGAGNTVECPQYIIEHGWISEKNCNFLVKPVASISQANNRIIKRGFEYLTKGLRGLLLPIPHGGKDFLDFVTGILLVTTFVSCNIYMALLIIQAIFEFGMSLILYPFNVLMWVAKPKDPEKWFDVWPAFDGIIKALQKLIISMIACAFIFVINVAIVKSLFQHGNSEFSVVANGSSTTNVPVPQMVQQAGSFGEHILLWMSAILTFFLMTSIFNETRKRLDSYLGAGSDDLYKSVTSDTKKVWGGFKTAKKSYGKAMEFKKLLKK